MRLFKSKKLTIKEQFFNASLAKYKQLDKKNRFSLYEKDFFKCLNDKTATTGFDTHYEYHPAWAARCLAKINPTKHIDISSKITFNVIVSAFIPIDFYDYRPAKIYNLNGLNCDSADLNNLPFADNSIESISCMHTIEHIGLGRYGDTVDPDGDIKAIRELQRVVKPGGSILFVIPIGKPKIQFNAHRIYSYDMIMEFFQGFELANFSLIPDNASDTGIINNATREQSNEQKYGCGCFWFKKLI